jgi:hypothetical protein
MELPKKLAQLEAFGDGTILCFNIGARGSVLMLGQPRHQVVTKVDVANMEQRESGHPTQSTSKYTMRD